MAKSKNEILLSIALEGDAEIKSKLKAVGEEGKRSLADIERQVGKAGETISRKFAESAAAPVGKLREALTPILEGAGLGQIGAGLASGGLLSRIFGAAGPAAAIAALTGVAVRLAKVREETEKTDARLSGLGGSRDLPSKLNASANKLGVDPKSIEGDTADFLAARRRTLAERATNNSPGFEVADAAGKNVSIVGGKPPIPATEEQFLAAREALVSGARLDKKSPGEAQDAISQLLKGVNNGGLTGDLVRQFSTALPNDANVLSSVLGPTFSRKFGSSEDLAKFLDRRGPAGPLDSAKVFGALAKAGPQIANDTAGEKGLSSSFEGLTASVKRVDTAFGNLAGGPLAKLVGGGLDKAAEVINKGADKVPGLDQKVRAAEFAPGGGSFIGPVRPQDIPTAPKSLGEVFSSDKGDLLGRIVGFIRGGESGPTNGFGGGNPFGVITDFISKAFANPASLQENQRPVSGPHAIGPPQAEDVTDSLQKKTDSANNGIPVGVSDGGPFQKLLDNIVSGIGNLNPQNLKVDTPTSGLGIRGDAEQAGDSLKQFASVVSEVIASLKGSVGAGSVQKVQVAAAGGQIHWLDGGGHVSGPGTTTSDSIPAMLSDKEYVIKAASARKIGRAGLDWLNAGMPGYADGGSVAASVTKLGAGNHQVSYDPSTGGAFVDGVLRLPGDPILQDPFVAAAIARSKADQGGASKSAHKSDFVGTFGGHVFGESGSYAAGGAVGHIAAFGGRSISFPGFADGGIAEVGGLGGLAPTVSDLGGGGADGTAGHMSVDLRTNHGDFRMMAPEEVVKQMSAAARDAAMVQTGPRPSWAYGSDR